MAPDQGEPPAAVEAVEAVVGVVGVVGVAGFVVTDASQRFFIGYRIVLDRDQGRHAAHRRGAALVAGLDQCERVGAHERHFHGDGAALCQTEIRVFLELLDARKDVVPASGVEAGRVVAQFVEDFFHLEGGEDGFDQYGGLDRAARQPNVVLCHKEDVVPQARFQM